jgi:hypothetical protein
MIYIISFVSRHITIRLDLDIRGPFEKFVDWRQCAAVIQREVMTVMPSCSGGGNVIAA